jgi:hypothetical protein
MKKFSLLALLFLGLFQIHAYALDGHGFRIISETIEHSPGVTGGFIPTAGKKSPGVAISWSQAYDALGRAGENVTVKGNHSINVTNYTNQNQIYVYKYEINCDGQYFRKVDKIEVRPGGVMNNHGDSYLTTYHRSSGLYRINASTDVSGESGNNHVSGATLRIVG